MRFDQITVRGLASLGAVVITLAVTACGTSDPAPTSVPSSGAYPPSAAPDPASVLSERQKDLEALSNASQAAHEARIDAINSLNP
jgi:hypothetical protein